MIKFLGKESVNYFILAYIAVGSTTGIKALLQSFTGTALNGLDESKLINIKNKFVELVVTPLDIICFILSIIVVAIYFVSKSWIFNNIIAIFFCVHALQFIFLGNFKTGTLLLSLLFFYDIFFVFGTDVMVTVAKSIDAPIKLQFPKDLTATPPQYSILGLGDIVIPGIFVSLCLRFDVLKSFKMERLADLIEQEKKGKADTNATVKFLMNQANTVTKSYFIAVIFGYLVAIITTVIIMILFEHGQPALLYLVPGCILSIFFLALVRGEFGIMWNFSEEKFISKPN
jgi:minor histocompatibility antigen H13